MTTYDVDYFIAKFSAIPDDGACALGHCGGFSPEGTFHKEALALAAIIKPTMPDTMSGSAPAWIANINDGRFCTPYAHLPTPRARILAALHDIKSKAEQAIGAYEDRPLVGSSTQLVTK